MGGLAIRTTVGKGDFSLTVDESIPLEGTTALFGPSGSGKTTLLRVIAGLEPSARGEITLDDVVWQDQRHFVPAHARAVGYVFQDGRLFRHLSVAGNLQFSPRRRRAARALDVDDVIEALDLGPLLDRKPGSLSGGEQQRVAIGRALLSNPRVLLMDEPLSSLDAARRLEIVDYIERLPGAFGVPMLYVTHSRAEVMRLAQRVVLLERGRVRAHGDVKTVLQTADAAMPAARAEAGAVLEARVAEHAGGLTRLSIGTQSLVVPQIAAAVDSIVMLHVPAREVAIATEKPAAISIRNVVAGRIERIFADETIYVELLVDVGGQHLRARITRDALDELELAEGRGVFALVKTVLFEDSFLL